MRIRYLLATFVALAAALGVTTPSASAQTACPSSAGGQYPPTAPSLQLSRTEVPPGGKIVVSGRCCPPNTVVSISFSPGRVLLGTANVGADGSFSTTVTIPADAAPGAHTITATGGAACNVSASVNVLGAVVERTRSGAAGDSGGTELVKTGSAFAIPFGVAGVGLILMGTLAVLATRRKRATT